MSVKVLMVDGVDVTDGVVFADAKFASAVNGRAGLCSFRVKDVNQTRFFTIGKEVTLDIDGVRSWGGYVTTIKRGYWWDYYDCRCKVNLVPRYWEVNGADYNILLEWRVLYDKTDPANPHIPLDGFPAGTADDVVLKSILANNMDLSGDGLGTSLIQHVGTPSTDTIIQAAAGWLWSHFMQYITFVTGAIYYIRPDKEIVLADVETVDAAFGISDEPIGGEVGCRDLEIDYNGSLLDNDAMVWGAGQGSASPVFSRATDTTSIAEHGRWQVGAPLQSIWKQATADTVSSTYVYGSPQSLRGAKDDQISARCAIYTAGLQCGQKVLLRSAVYGFSEVIPIRMMEITFPTATDVKWSLILSHENNQPWSGFDVIPFGPFMQFPPFPPFPPFPAFDIPGFPAFDGCRYDCRCIDPFVRSTSGDWGPSPILCLDWHSSSNGTHYTDGDFGVQTNTVLNEVATDWLKITQWDGSSLEFLAKAHLPFDDEFTTLGMPEFAIGHSTSTNASGPIYTGVGPAPFFRWRVFPGDAGVFDNVYAGVLAFNGTSAAQAGPVAVIAGSSGEGEWVWIRCRLEDEWIRIKVWFDGDSEPGAYQVNATPAGGPPAEFVTRTSYGLHDCNIFAIPTKAFNGGTISVDSLEFVSGLACSDVTQPPCWTEDTVSILVKARLIHNSGMTWAAPANLSDRITNSTGFFLDFSPSEASGDPIIANRFSLLARRIDPQRAGVNGDEVAPFGGCEPNNPDDVWINDAFKLDAIFDSPFYIRAEVTQTSHRIKAWQVSDSEPVGWNITSGLGYDFTAWKSIYCQSLLVSSRSSCYGTDIVAGLPGVTREPFTILIDSISITGHAPITQTDEFNRGTIEGWGNSSLNGQNWSASYYGNYYPSGGPLAVLANGDGVIARYNSFDIGTQASNATLRLPLTCDLTDDQCAELFPPDLPVGYTCENLTRISTPSGVDPFLTYYQTSNVYQAGTTKVWIDGLRLAWYDYDELPNEGLIVMHANVNTGGGDSFDPPKTVYACYIGG